MTICRLAFPLEGVLFELFRILGLNFMGRPQGLRVEIQIQG
jgi:hypothetical protein